VDFADPADTHRMLPGYSADIEVIIEQREKVVRVPTEGILEGNRVLVLGADGRLAQRTVETGLSNWVYTEVERGLDPGERIVVSVDRDGVEDGAHARAENDRPGDD
jgi:HlyD family secretion protein